MPTMASTLPRLTQDRNSGHRPMDITDNLILGHLESCRGRDKAISRTVLAGMVGLKTRQLERRIKNLVEGHGHLIGSSVNKQPGKPMGYYVPVNADELDMVTGQLMSRAMSLLVRVSKIRKIAVEELFGQLRMGER